MARFYYIKGIICAALAFFSIVFLAVMIIFYRENVHSENAIVPIALIGLTFYLLGKSLMAFRKYKRT